MRITCPQCPNNPPLKAFKLSNGLFSYNCQSCDGNYLSSRNYHKWKTISPIKDENEKAPSVQKDSSEALICPECRHIMFKYLVSPDIEFRVDFCRSCNGVWLDKNEWEHLESKDLAKNLNLVFTDSWQNKIRKISVEKRLDQLFKDRIGEKSYVRIKEFKNWLATKPNKGEIVAYLNEN